MFQPSPGTVGTFVHGSPGSENISLGKLWCPEGTGHEAVAAANAYILVDQDDAIFALVDGIHRTDRHAGCIGAVHTGNRDAFFSRFSLVDRNNFAAIDAHGYLVPFLAGDNAAITIYTTPSCGYCNVAKNYFRENRVPFTEYDVSRDQRRADEMVKKSGQMGVPVIDINGRIIVGFNKSEIERSLHR